jgi:type I restriction enzyme S subunit
VFDPGTVILVVRSGILKHTLPVTRLSIRAAINQDVKAMIPKTDAILPAYLATWLEIMQTEVLSLTVKHSTTVQSVNSDEFELLNIPQPDRNVQIQLVANIDVARAARREKLTRADALLSGLDAFVLDALGLTLPPTDGRTVYAVRLRDARQRFDPDYNSPRFRTLREKIEHGRFPAQSVGSLFHPIVSGFAAGGDDQTDDPTIGIPHVRPLNITNTAELTFEGTKRVPRAAVELGDFLKKGEVLFNNTNSTAWVGKTVVFDADRECACSNHITRLTLIDKNHSPYYFAALFNALRGLGFFGLLSTNFNNQAGINVDTLKAVRLSVPGYKVQEKIAAEVARRREEARCLRDDACTIWDLAKHQFEEELLGPENNAAEKADITKRGHNK